jgi:hypothetical protein
MMKHGKTTPNRSRKEKKMNACTKGTSLAVLIALGLALAAPAAEPPKPESPPDWDKLVGQPVDAARFARTYRADRKLEEQPPESLILIEKYAAMTGEKGPFDPAKSAALRKVLVALDWGEIRSVPRLELSWPAKEKMPPLDQITVTYLHNYFKDKKAGLGEVQKWIHSGRPKWLGAQLAQAERPELGADGRTLSFAIPLETWGVVVCVAGDADASRVAVPAVRAALPHVWRREEVLIEWGFQDKTKGLAFDGSIESTGVCGGLGKAAPLAGDTATTITQPQAWKSPAAGQSRRGIVVPVYHTDAARGPDRTFITVQTASGGFTFQPQDLDQGPILAPEYGFFVAKAAGAATARAFQEELAAKGRKTVRQMTREHPEQTFEGAIQGIGFKPGELPALAELPYPPAMTVEVPDKYVNGIWRSAAWYLIRGCLWIDRADIPKASKAGPGMSAVRAACTVLDDPKDPRGIWLVGNAGFSPLAVESYNILWALDHLGMHTVAQDGITVWLEEQRPDGQVLLKSGIEKQHEAGSLVLPWVLAEHYFLTGDKAWLKKEAPRLKAAAQWIVNRRRLSMKEQLTARDKEDLRAGKQSPHGLQSYMNCGDGNMQGGNLLETYYYVLDAWAYQSVRRLAEALGELDPAAGAELSAETERYGKDILAVLDRSILLSPVVRVRDGTCRSFMPQGFQHRGLMRQMFPPEALYRHCGPESNDIVCQGASLEAMLRAGLCAADDPRIAGYFEVLEDIVLMDKRFAGRGNPRYEADRDWFMWAGTGYQAGWERACVCYLVMDDVPGFLRSLFNNAAKYTSLNGGPEDYFNMGEHGRGGKGGEKSHTKGVFLSNVRNMLVMEIGDALWLARATPRAWLDQGKKIAIKNAPTYFGTLAYEIVSDADHGKISATIEMPARKAPKEVVLRFRHPKSAPIKSVTVNGKPWTGFNADKETITLKGLTGRAVVTAQY